MWEKHNKIWEVIKNKLGIKFHSKPIYENKYLKAKVREFDGVIKQTFWVIIRQKKHALYLYFLHNY